MEKSHTQAQILNIKLDSTSKEEVLTTIGNRIKNKDKFIILTPNPEIIMAAQKDSKLASILNSADFSIPDGIGLKIAAPNLTIIKGRKLMIDLLGLANSKNMKVYFLGSSDVSNKISVKKAKRDYPNIIIKGNPGPRLDINGVSLGKTNIISDINSFSPQILFVAFGTPKEQKWIHLHKNELKVNCIMEVGGSLDYFAGTASLPPKLFESLGLEWLWRLIHEPSRAPRIFTALIIFPVKVLLSKVAH